MITLTPNSIQRFKKVAILAWELGSKFISGSSINKISPFDTKCSKYMSKPYKDFADDDTKETFCKKDIQRIESLPIFDRIQEKLIDDYYDIIEQMEDDNDAFSKTIE